MNIAIDGPGGSGKSVLAKNIAKKLGLVYVDTGALYRSVGLYSLEHGIARTDREAIIKTLDDISVELRYEKGEQHVYLCGADVGDRIRTPDASMYASAVSALPEVRAFLDKIQRDMVARGDVVMDGRDIGTVIMPDADVKIFLFASPEHRARRRYEELLSKGQNVDYESVLADIIERDRADRERDTAPAVPADDAVLLDNSGFEPADTFAAAIHIINEKTNGSYSDVL